MKIVGKKQKILVLAFVATLSATLATYAYATSQVGVTKFSSISGGLITSSATFTVGPLGPVFCPGNPDPPSGPASGPFVGECTLAPRGNSVSSPSRFSVDSFAFNQLTAGDWFLSFQVTNRTDLPAGAVYSANFTEIDPTGGMFAALYLSTTVPPSCTVCVGFLVIDIGPTFTTPFAYTLTMQRVS